jgi:hypothetical protein
MTPCPRMDNAVVLKRLIADREHRNPYGLDGLDRHFDELEALRVALADMEDAARYRWLREHPSTEWCAFNFPGVDDHNKGPWIDAAIDTARASSAGEGGHD